MSQKTFRVYKQLMRGIMKVRFDIEITRETVQLINDDPSTGKIIANVTQQRVGVLLNCVDG